MSAAILCWIKFSVAQELWGETRNSKWRALFLREQAEMIVNSDRAERAERAL